MELKFKSWYVLFFVCFLIQKQKVYVPSALILIIADQLLNDSLYCSNKYNGCICEFIGKLYILL